MNSDLCNEVFLQEHKDNIDFINVPDGQAGGNTTDGTDAEEVS